MQKITLIGKGLVAKHVSRQFNLELIQQYDSKNIQDLALVSHDVVICAAPSAKKWIANADPESDLKNCNVLIDNLKKAKIKKVVLFSTVDVYSTDSRVLDEDSEQYSSHPYGKNRRMIEEEISRAMPCSIIRLPALFGDHLEKNYIFDLMNSNNLRDVKVNTSFQWLDLRRINECLSAAEKHELVNYVVEPLSTLTIVNKFFPDKLEMLETNSAGVNYDIKSKYAPGGYFHSKEQVIEDMEQFFNDWHNNSRYRR